MIYLYTGATKSGAVQADPELSLGSFVSSSPVPNDLLQNVFSEATYLSIQQRKRETKLIALQNNDANRTATGLSISFFVESDVEESVSEGNTDYSLSQYRVAFVEPGSDGCFESIIHSAALPINATFQDVVQGESLALPDILPTKSIGVWITRLYDFSSDDLKTKDLAYWQAQLSSPTKPGTEDMLDIKLDYTLV